MLHIPSSSNVSWALADDIIVENSEPERGARRKSAKQPQRVDLVAIRKKGGDSNEILELTDSESSLPDPCTDFNRFSGPVLDKSPSLTESPSDPGSRLRLSLDRFAFTSSSAKITSRSVSTAAIQTKAAPSGDVADKSKTSRSRQKARLSAINVSESAISQLERCICCETRWTVRKTVPQKLNHIEACSKKRSYSSETVSILIRKELNIAGEAIVESATTKTHLGSIVQDVLTKGKQKKVGSTVRQYTHETREIMLRRARAILGPVVGLDGEGKTSLDLQVSTQAIQATSLRNQPTTTGAVTLGMSPLSPTWSFRPSRLRFQTYRNFDTRASYTTNRSDLPPFHEALQVNGPNDVTGDDCSVVIVPIPLHNQPRKSRLVLVDDNLASEVSRMALTSNAPCDEGSISSASESLTSTASETPKRRRGRPPFRSSFCATTISRAVTSKRQVCRVGRVEERWRKKFHARIMQDPNLYNRILRYEPIHFNVFQQLAPPNRAPGSLKLKIVTFLDHQAINFYGYHSNI